MSDNIGSTIKSAELSSELFVWSGQCLSIAGAINDHFGGRIIMCSELPGEGFDHALVEIDGKLYDGSGYVSWSETVTRFVDPIAQREDIDAHFYYPDEPFTQFSSAFQQSAYDYAYARIGATLDEDS